jgi:sn-glycerol 3-phosphate transport system substrate-binding protein
MSAINSPIMQDYFAGFPQARVAFDQIPLAKPELTTFNAAQIWRILNDSIQSAVTGERTAAQAMRDAQLHAEDALRRFQ